MFLNSKKHKIVGKNPEIITDGICVAHKAAIIIDWDKMTLTESLYLNRILEKGAIKALQYELQENE